MAYVYFKQSDFSKITCIKKAYGDKIYIGSYDIDKKKYSALKDITLCTANDLVLDTKTHYVCDCWSETLKTLDLKDWDKIVKHEYNYESNADLLLKYAKDNNIPVGPGRGSAAGSLVSYSLGITTIDPIRHRLLFERF